MKVLAIRGCNIASLEGDFVIDFTAEPLASAGIFAISGPTGSGKSTLLDAMCLALFARTPRTEQAREKQVKLKDVSDDFLTQNDARFLLRRGTASGYAEVDFVALNGHRYRSRWSVARARGKESGHLQAAHITLYNLDTEQEEKGRNTDLQARIIELIGLTFDQFTRSVLLAQNDFSTFLKAEQGEKASLLEKLTGTELYSKISQTIYLKNSEAKVAFEKLNAQVQGIELLPQEEEKVLQGLLKEAKEKLSELEKAKSERQRLQDAVKSYEMQLATKENQQMEFSLAADRVVRLLKESKQKKESSEGALAKMNEESTVLQQQLQLARQLDVELNLAKTSLSEAETRLKNAETQKKGIERKLQTILIKRQKAQEECTALQTWLEKYKSKEGIAEQLPALSIHLDACLAAQTAIDQSVGLIADYTVRKNQADAQQKTFLEKINKYDLQQQAIDKERKSLEDLLETLDASRIERERVLWNEKREDLLMEQTRFMAKGNCKELRDKLIQNTPCPVCGSLEHPYATHEAHAHLLQLATQISEATMALDTLKKEKSQHESSQKRLADLQKTELNLHRSKTTDEKKRADLQNDYKSFVDKIEREEKEKQIQQELLSKSFTSANQLFRGDGWQVNWKANPNGFKQTLDDFAHQWHEKKERLRTLEQERSAILAEYETCAGYLPALQEQVDGAKKVVEEKQMQWNKLTIQRGSLFDGKAADQVERTFNQEFETLQKDLNLLLENITKLNGEVEKYRGLIEQQKKDIKDFSDVLTQGQQKLLEWQSAYQEKSDGQTLEESIDFFTNQKTEAHFKLRTNEENLQKIAGFQKELTNKKEVSEQWAKLNDLVGSSDGGKFRRIAQGYTLDVLLTYANVQLKQLTHRYRLERVPETLALQVIDQDMCDEIRTVHSLSGGESFLVSLALALGLSSLSSNRMKVESLFIDEGFGSLDAETLRVAMDALESLRTQGRKIGVISHVQEMTERIPVQIRVNRAGNGRSFIEVL